MAQHVKQFLPGRDIMAEARALERPMGASLKSAARYLAYELGDKHIRVNAVSPEP